MPSHKLSLYPNEQRLYADVCDADGIREQLCRQQAERKQQLIAHEFVPPVIFERREPQRLIRSPNSFCAYRSRSVFSRLSRKNFLNSNISRLVYPPFVPCLLTSISQPQFNGTVCSVPTRRPPSCAYFPPGKNDIDRIWCPPERAPACLRCIDKPPAPRLSIQTQRTILQTLSHDKSKNQHRLGDQAENGSRPSPEFHNKALHSRNRYPDSCRFAWRFALLHGCLQ